MNGQQPALWSLECSSGVSPLGPRATARRPQRASEGPSELQPRARQPARDLQPLRRADATRHEPVQAQGRTKRRVYQCRHVKSKCRHVKSTTGLCDAPTINAEIVDSEIVANLRHYLGDFDAWKAQIESDQAAQRAALDSEVQRAGSPGAEAPVGDRPRVDRADGSLTCVARERMPWRPKGVFELWMGHAFCVAFWVGLLTAFVATIGAVAWHERRAVKRALRMPPVRTSR